MKQLYANKSHTQKKTSLTHRASACPKLTEIRAPPPATPLIHWMRACEMLIGVGWYPAFVMICVCVCIFRPAGPVKMTCTHLCYIFFVWRWPFPRDAKHTLWVLSLGMDITSAQYDTGPCMSGNISQGIGTIRFPFDMAPNSTGWVRMSLLDAQRVDAHEDVLK